MPELKAIKKQLESHEYEFTHLWEEIKALREEIKDLRQEMNTRFEAIYKDIHEIKLGQREILLRLDIEKG